MVVSLLVQTCVRSFSFLCACVCVCLLLLVCAAVYLSFCSSACLSVCVRASLSLFICLFSLSLCSRRSIGAASANEALDASTFTYIETCQGGCAHSSRFGRKPRLEAQNKSHDCCPQSALSEHLSFRLSGSSMTTIIPVDSSSS